MSENEPQIRERKYSFEEHYGYGKGYITLPVQLPELPEEFDAEGTILHRKDSFHVSLLCVKELAEGKEDVEEKLLDLFERFTKECEVEFTAYTGEFRYVVDQGRRTIVALCEVTNLDKLRDMIHQELGIVVPKQPTHVTLYTLQPNLGIGLNSPEAMDAKSVAIEAPTELCTILGV